MVDDSPSMKPLQAKLAAQLPSFMQRLIELDGGLPDLHVAVISSSLGAGAFADVPGCTPSQSPGDDLGRFQHKAGCGLNAGATFIKASADGTANNFTGPIESVFTCLAQLGDQGCGFEHPFESMRQALGKSVNPNDPDNGGFWRDDALLGIVMLTNEDDCSVPGDSQLFNTSVMSVADQPPLGGLWSYRCNEFGHRCDQPLPHTADGLPVTLTGCQSKENTDTLYHLTPVAEFVQFLKAAKDPKDLFVAVIGGPSGGSTDRYEVHARKAVVGNGGTEMQPEISHSCVASDGTYADPGVRLLKFVADLNGLFLPICAPDFRKAMDQIAEQLIADLKPRCFPDEILVRPDNGNPDCQVLLRSSGTPSGASSTDVVVPFCGASVASASASQPCWRFSSDPPDNACPTGRHLQFCWSDTCGPMPTQDTTRRTAYLSCATVP